MRPTSKPTATLRAWRGFTLVELVAVIAITAIVAAMVAVFIRLPMQAYQDIQRRAEITDAADTVFSRLKRDLQNALPNSVRVTTNAGISYLEFLQVRTAGRYRSVAPLPSVATGANTCADTNGDGFADENVLQFGIADTCFTSLGAVASLGSIVPNSDFVVVYNLGTGFTNADAYANITPTTGNRSLITAVGAGAGGENVISFTPHTFNLDSPGRRFQVISGPVSYVCNPGAGTMSRVSGYAISSNQPTPAGGVLLAQNITACTITYDQNVINQRAGIVAIALSFADPAGGTAVNLFQQIQVSNVP